MRKLIYEYSPLNRGDVLAPLADVSDVQSPYWQSLHAYAPPTSRDSNAAAAATAAAADVAAFEKKLIYTPCSYVATEYFVVKPQEWFIIIFTCQPCDDPRPDVLYDPVAAWPMPELEISKYQMALLVQNNSRYASIAVHEKSRLHHLLQLQTLDSCFTLLRHDDKQQQNNEDSNIMSPPPNVSAAAAAPVAPPLYNFFHRTNAAAAAAAAANNAVDDDVDEVDN